MNLRRITAFSLILLTLVVILVQFFVTNSIVSSGFERLEEMETVADLRRVEKALGEAVVSLDTFLWDWASWDDTYLFVQDRNQAYRESNLAPTTFLEQGLAAMVFWDASGNMAFGRAYAEDGAEVPELLRELRNAVEEQELPPAGGPESGEGGVLVLPQGAFLVARRPVLTSAGEGPAMGKMLMARKVSQEYVDNLAERLELQLELRILGRDVPLQTPVVQKLLSADFSGSAVVSFVSEDHVQGHSLVRDVFGEPALLAGVTLPRAIMRQGDRVARYNYIFLALVVVAYSLLAYLLLRTKVISRVEALGRQISFFNPRAESAIRLHMNGDDEITELAGNVNTMLRKIDESHREIEEQHKVIAESERFLNQMLNSIKAGIMLVDPDTRIIVDINDFALKMVGRSYDEVVGQVCHKLTCPSEVDKCPILDLEQEHDFSARWLLTRDRGQIPIMKSVAFVEKNDRKLLLETFIDISELEQARREVELARDELESKVEERTRELEQANRELLAMDQAKTMFLSSASHELRTPLTSVMGFLKLMDRTFATHFSPVLREHKELTPRVMTFLENLTVVRSEATRLGRLVDDLLDLNKIESGRMQWRDARTNVAKMLHEAREMGAGLLEDKPDVTLEVHAEPGLPDVVVDRDRVHQVLNNLVSNAVKFTDQGTITLSARSKGDLVEIAVRDTGMGIDPKDHERIFDIFYQSQDEDHRSTRPFGTGLGLAICRNIIRHYKGDIRVESAPGAGSAFIFNLPASDS